jgi:hypothetical protein
MRPRHDRIIEQEPDTLLEEATALEATGQLIDAARLLCEMNRTSRNARIEAHLVSLRHRAFRALDRTPPATVPARVVAEPTSELLVPHDMDSMTPSTLRQSLARHGCAWIRGLIKPERADGLVRDIDEIFSMFDARNAGKRSETLPWYEPFEPEEGAYRVGGRRKWVRASGAIWTADSPRMLAELCELLSDTGVGDLVTACLGERPALSANKCTIRRVPIDTDTNWHQDGAFLGTDVRTMNVWLALSDCDMDSPGLEIVPCRFDDVLPTGTQGAIFDWSVSPEIVVEAAQARGVSSFEPAFQAGDALLFDQLLLHRTAIRPGMTRERYALETWLFAPSSYPEGQIPLVY